MPTARSTVHTRTYLRLQCDSIPPPKHLPKSTNGQGGLTRHQTVQSPPSHTVCQNVRARGGSEECTSRGSAPSNHALSAPCESKRSQPTPMRPRWSTRTSGGDPGGERPHKSTDPHVATWALRRDVPIVLAKIRRDGHQRSPQARPHRRQHAGQLDLPLSATPLARRSPQTRHTHPPAHVAHRKQPKSTTARKRQTQVAPIRM